MPGEWIRRPQAEASAVFVHGILSNGEGCWRNANGSYWPELLKSDPKLAPLGIYVFTYQTGIFSGSYRIGDIVDALKEYMRLDGVLESNRLIFVCHSMGGIVVRKFIVERAAELIAAGKEINLFLIASPSLGSSYADWLSPIARLFGHAQADALRFVRNNDWLKDLDKEFINLKESGNLKIKGKELVENQLVILPKLFGRQVVEPFAGARYFGEPYKVAESDHFSIAKPDSESAIQHRLLCKFILEITPTGGSKTPEPASPAVGRFPIDPANYNGMLEQETEEAKPEPPSEIGNGIWQWLPRILVVVVAVIVVVAGVTTIWFTKVSGTNNNTPVSNDRPLHSETFDPPVEPGIVYVLIDAQGQASIHLKWEWGPYAKEGRPKIETGKNVALRLPHDEVGSYRLIITTDGRVVGIRQFENDKAAAEEWDLASYTIIPPDFSR